MQQSGQLLYVPSGWSHATINLDEAIGLAVEFGHCKLLNPIILRVATPPLPEGVVTRDNVIRPLNPTVTDCEDLEVCV